MGTPGVCVLAGSLLLCANTNSLKLGHCVVSGGCRQRGDWCWWCCRVVGCWASLMIVLPWKRMFRAVALSQWYSVSLSPMGGQTLLAPPGVG